MRLWRTLVTLSLLSAVVGADAFSRQSNVTECCAPPAGLAEEEKNVAELSKVAGECPTADEAGLA
ncbi:MAG: hypothetical protein HYW49_11770, partial [Deltaproteobacteria bacterium]|nr:hypothetical protein [Deltaproteobacteria bacterium]